MADGGTKQRDFMSTRAHNAGAALVIALAVFAILLSIGVTFVAMTRMEVKSSSNVESAGQAEMVADAGVAQAMSVLNQDRIEHPNVTSTDHAWSTYFNGAWLAGKGCFFRGTGNDAWIMARTGIPYVHFDELAKLDDFLLWDRSPLYVPRFEDGAYVRRSELYDALPSKLASDHPFVIANDPSDPNAYLDARGLLPTQQIDRWADVDNDGDGLKDSMWLPMAADTFATTDGVDNNLDSAIDEASESPVFVYWGGNDGLDNNENGYVDEEAEKWYLTVPLFGMKVRVVDSQGNFLSTDGRPLTYVDGKYRSIETGAEVPSTAVDVVTIPESGTISISTPKGTVVLDKNNVDVIDNDYSTLINDYDIVARRKLDWTPNEPRRYHEIAYSYLKGLSMTRTGGTAVNLTDGTNATEVNNAASSDIVSIQCTGEPVCELVGRYAVLIRDEASKVNINVAGAMSYDDRTQRNTTTGQYYNDTTTPIADVAPMRRALQEGLGPQEYDIRLVRPAPPRPSVSAAAVT